VIDDIPPDMLLAVGRVAAASASLEFHLSQLIWTLTADDVVLNDKKAGLYDFASLWHVENTFPKVIEQRRSQVPDADAFLTVAQEAKRLLKRRGRLVHSVIVTDYEHGGFKAVHPNTGERTVVTTAVVNGLADEIVLCDRRCLALDNPLDPMQETVAQLWAMVEAMGRHISAEGGGSTPQ
jgi:hypothetical protein